jgi:hypothetical protein
MIKGFTCYGLSREETERLRTLFPPRYAKLSGDHITVRYDVPLEGTDLPPDAKIEVIGRADDGNGIEALIVTVDGKRCQPGGRPFHITWSLDPEARTPRTIIDGKASGNKKYATWMSGPLIAEGKHSELFPAPIPIKARPQFVATSIRGPENTGEPTVEETLAFIKHAHAGATDKSGAEYYLHPVAVMNNLPKNAPPEAKLAALLHDVIEDTHYNRARLEKRLGYSKEVLDVVELVSNDPAKPMPYPDKIRSIIDSGNIAAILVKYADMRENTNPARLSKLEPELRARLLNKYRLPLIMLTETVKNLGSDVAPEYTVTR